MTSRSGSFASSNVLFTVQLALMLEDTTASANCFHPGMVATGITRDLEGVARFTTKLMEPFHRRPRQGAETLVWLVDSPEITGVSGGYFVDRRQAVVSAAARDGETARELWKVSEAQTQLSAGWVR